VRDISVDYPIVSRLWKEREYVRVGHILFDAIPSELRPIWAVNLLKIMVKKTGLSTIEIENLITVASDPSTWNQAHAAFSAIRKQVRKLENARPVLQDKRLLLNLYYFAEIVAKVTYNATDADDKFDEDSGWHLPSICYSIAQLLNDPSFLRGLLALLVRFPDAT
jgi:hypothetical protein